MGLLAYMTPFSEDGSNEYRVEIHDEDFAGTSFEVKARTNIANTFDGDPKNRFKVINGTSFDVTARLNLSDSNHLGLVNSFALQQEGRFFLKVTKFEKNVGSGVFEPIFIGNITIDETFYDNKPYSDLEISADDGLNRLKSQEFKSDTLISNAYGDDVYYYEGEETVMEMIFKCLTAVGTQDYYDDFYDFLRVNHNWYESNMPDILNPALERVLINHRIFTRRDDEGEYYTSTKAEVLNFLLNWCHCKITYKWGSYYIDNLNEIGNDSKTYVNYRKDGSFNGRTTETGFISTVGTNGVKCLGGKFGFLPPLKEACVTLNYITDNYGYTPTLWDPDNTELVSLGDFQVNSVDTSIFGTFLVRFIYEADLTFTKLIFWFGVTIKVNIYGTDYYYATEQTEETRTEDIEDSGGNVTGTYTYNYYQYTTTWTTTPGVFLFRSEKSYLGFSGVELTENWEFVTESLETISGVNIEDIGELFVKIEFIKGTNLEDHNNDYFDGSNPAYTFTWRTYQAYFTPYESGQRVLKDDIGIKYCSNFSDKNSTIISLDTRIGDVAFNSNNRIKVFDGTDYVASGEQWGVGTLSGTLKSQELLLNEIIAGQPYTLRRFIGTFSNIDDPRDTVKYDGVTWVGHRTMYDLRTKKWEGEFLQFVNDPQSITISEGAIKADVSTGTLSSGGPSTDSGGTPPVQTQIYPFEFVGPLTFLDMTSKSIEVPDIDTLGVLTIDFLITMKRNGYPMEFNVDGINGYSIDKPNNRLTLNRELREGERIRGHIKVNI